MALDCEWFPRGGAAGWGRPLGARLVGSGDNGGCGARGPAVAPDGSGRPRRERAGLRRRRRRPGAGRRSGREAEGAPPAGRARGRLRGAGAGARAGSRGGYDDPATGPRISSPPPPPRGSPSSRLRTRPTGGESDRAGRGLGREQAPIRFPRRGREGRGLSGAPGLRGAPPWARPHPGRGAPSGGPAASGRGGACVPGKARRLRACFRGNSPCLLPLLFGACCCPQMTGGRLAPPHPAGFFPAVVAGSQRVACACVFHSSAYHHGFGLFVLFATRKRCLERTAVVVGWVWKLFYPLRFCSLIVRFVICNDGGDYVGPAHLMCVCARRI